MLFVLLLLMSKMRSLAGGVRRCYSSITSVWQYCYQIFQVLILMMKQLWVLYIFLLYLVTTKGESDNSTLNQYQVPFIFLSFAIAIVYFTLLFVYVFRYRIFRKPVPIKIGSQSRFSNRHRIPIKHDVLNRLLHRLKPTTKRLNE